MNSRNWLNLTLVILVAILAAIAFYEPGIKHENHHQKIIEIAAAQITQLEIRRLQEADIKLVKQGDAWLVSSTFNGIARRLPAHDWKVERLLEISSLVSTQQIANDNADLTKFGLAQPRIVLVVNNTEIDFGEINPVNHLRYIRTNNKVFLVEENIYSHIISEHKDFVSKALLPDHPTITTIVLPKFKIERTQNQGLHATPNQNNATPDSLQMLIDEWRFAQAVDLDFVNAFDAKRKVVLQTETGETIELLIQSENKDLYIYKPNWGLRYRFLKQNESKFFEIPTPAD